MKWFQELFPHLYYFPINDHVFASPEGIYIDFDGLDLKDCCNSKECSQQRHNIRIILVQATRYFENKQLKLCYEKCLKSLKYIKLFYEKHQHVAHIKQSRQYIRTVINEICIHYLMTQSQCNDEEYAYKSIYL